jgi:hypothetical protein
MVAARAVSELLHGAGPDRKDAIGAERELQPNLPTPMHMVSTSRRRTQRR